MGGNVILNTRTAVIKNLFKLAAGLFEQLNLYIDEFEHKHKKAESM